MQNWSSYFWTLTGDQTQAQVEARVKVVDQTTISRWRRGESSPKDPVTVAAIAEAYGANVLEAFVAAGFLSHEQAGMPPVVRIESGLAMIDDIIGLTDGSKRLLKEVYAMLQVTQTVGRSSAMWRQIESQLDLDDETRRQWIENFDALRASPPEPRPIPVKKPRARKAP